MQAMKLAGPIKMQCESEFRGRFPESDSLEPCFETLRGINSDFQPKHVLLRSLLVIIILEVICL